VDRCVRFFGLFAAKAPDTEVGLAVLEELLKHAAGHLGAADKGARLRACQLLQQLLAGLPAGLLLDEAVLAELAGALQQRLQDKLPAVRAEAATALCRLIAASASDVSVCGTCSPTAARATAAVALWMQSSPCVRRAAAAAAAG
jgi:hypothetical protein